METVLTILFLIFLEGILSFDNALALAALVKYLPESQQKKALSYGIIGAFGFRALSLFFITSIMNNIWVKGIGGLYLLFLFGKHFIGGEGDEYRKRVSGHSFIRAIVIVELTDIAFSIDSILAAVAVSKVYFTVLIGGVGGIIMMRFAAGIFINLMKIFPRLEHSAFLLVGLVGMKLVLESESISFESGSLFYGLWALMIASLGFGFTKKEVIA